MRREGKRRQAAALQSGRDVRAAGYPDMSGPSPRPSPKGRGGDASGRKAASSRRTPNADEDVRVPGYGLGAGVPPAGGCLLPRERPDFLSLFRV